MSERWISETTKAIMLRVVARREALGMSTAELAEQMTAAGMPFTVPALTTVEKGQRRSITVQELLVFAHVLETSPLELLWPVDGDVEMVPEVILHAQDAREWTAADLADLDWRTGRLKAMRAAQALLNALEGAK